MRSRKMMAADCGSVRMRRWFHMSGGKAIEQFRGESLGKRWGRGHWFFDSKRSGLWMGLHGGLGFFKDAKLRMYTTRDGLGSGKVVGLQLVRTGHLGRNRRRPQSPERRPHHDPHQPQCLPCDIIHWTMEDNDHDFCYTRRVGFGARFTNRTGRLGWRTWSNGQNDCFRCFDGVRNHSTPFSGYSPRVAKGSRWENMVHWPRRRKCP